MCVPIDYAKKDHVVMFCNGYGDILRKPFSVKNTPEGVNYLIEQVTRSCLHRSLVSTPMTPRNNAQTCKPVLIVWT